MSWAWPKKNEKVGDPWSMEQPASKKRKLESKTKPEKESTDQNKDEWDDSLELTQDDLANIDVMASQAISMSQDPAKHASTSSTTHVPTTNFTETSFAIPSYPAQKLTNKSTSSSSSESSLQPHSLSSRSVSDASNSLSSNHSSSGSNENGVASKDAIEILQAKLELQVKKAQEEKYRFDGEVKFLRQSIHKQEEELEKLRAQRDETMDKQKLALTEKLQSLQAQIESLTSQAQFKELEFQELQKQNLAQQQKLKKLEQQQQNQQTHTSEESSSRTSHSPSIKSSPRKIPVRPSPPSKLEQQKEKENVSASQKQGFPTRFSFMEQTVVPLSGPSKSQQSNASCQTTEAITEAITSSTRQTQRRRLCLDVGNSHAPGDATGSQIVSHLLQASGLSWGSTEQPKGQSWDPGLTGLLHAMSTSLTVAGLSYTRAKDTSILTPVKPKRSLPNLRSPGPDSTDSSIQVVSKDHFNMAIAGLTRLLEEDSGNAEDSGGGAGRHNLQRSILNMLGHKTEQLAQSISQQGNTVMEKPSEQESTQPDNNTVASKTAGLSGTSKSSVDGSAAANHMKQNTSSSTSFSSREQKLGSGAVLLLPLLRDYIQHYVDLINSPLIKASTPYAPGNAAYPPSSSLDSSRSVVGSSSYDSSLDSLSSCVIQLLHDGRVYAGSVEGYALSALRCLSLLINLCPVVGQAIIESQSDVFMCGTVVTTTNTSSSSCVEVEAEPQSKSKYPSGAEADDERSTSSSEIRMIVGAHGQSLSIGQPSTLVQRRVDNVNLLHLLLRLAGQDVEEGNSSPAVISEALTVLTGLCQCCTVEHIPKLEMIITRGVLVNCLKQSKQTSILLSGLRLISSLMCWEKLLARLCSKSENCPLYLLHRVCSHRRQGIQARELIGFYTEYISCISSSISQHRAAFFLLLANACPCSTELVVGVVLSLYKLFSLYRSSPATHLLNTLAQGVSLIHTLAQGDSAFVQHRASVQLQYCRLLSGLATVMRAQQKTWEFHLSALEELCDFEPDIADLSQESETENRMDQS